MPEPVYLDYNATAPIRPEAARAVEAALELGANPSSVHAAGRAARKVVEDTRECVAAMAGARPSEVVFTSGASVANAQALLRSGRERVLVSAVEHDSVLAPRADAEVVPVDAAGVVDLAALDAMLAGSDRPALVALMLGNNETGVVQPVAEAVEIAHRHGALLLCDAVQAAGKMPIGFGQLGADFMSFSAHKLAGPHGSGALIVSEAVEVGALIMGGGQERGRRGGTENLPGIAGFGAAAEIAARLEDHERIDRLRSRLESAALDLVPDARIFGREARRLPNTTCLAIPGRAASTQVMALDLEGYAVSAGAACSSGKVKSSHVLRAMGVGEDWSNRAIRVSLGWATTEREVDGFVAAWGRMARQGDDGTKAA